MLTFRALSALLSYPRPELKAETGAAAHILRSEGILTGSHLEKVCQFLARIVVTPQLEAESSWIDAFDRGRSTSLYLFEHIHGESRDRGQAMVRLLARYRAHGLELQSVELPDFLPLFLEFLSTCRQDEATKYLSEVGDIVARIGQRLRKRGAPHACLLEAIASLVSGNTHDEASEASQEDRDDSPAALDAAWEESPVTFDSTTLSTAERLVGATIQGQRMAMQKN
jgi:nitrate reductase delta subunit